jgi:hypothetical protein
MGNALMPALHYKLKFSNRQTKLGNLIFTKENTASLRAQGKFICMPLQCIVTHTGTQPHIMPKRGLATFDILGAADEKGCSFGSN